MNTNITPALNVDNMSYLSAAEFQHQLYSWMENRGLLMELRAYLKTNMIEILRNASSGSGLWLKPKVPISPKKQALNLLIAEYMANLEYHFSLCVFASEASLNNTFCHVNKQKNEFKFYEKEVFDILESLGIMRFNKQAKCIYLMYQEGQEPLLNYFLPSTPMYSGSLSEKDLFYNILDKEFDFATENLNRLLQNSNLSPLEINQLKYYIKWISDKQKERERQLEGTFKLECKVQTSKYKVKLHDLEKSTDLERKNFEAEIACLKEEIKTLKGKEKKNENFVVKLKDSIVKHRLDKMKPREAEKVISSDNIDMKQCSKENIRSEKKYASSATNIQMENKNLQCDESDFEVKKQLVDVGQQTIKSITLENTALKQTVQQLEYENDNLRADNYSFNQQLDELAHRATLLMAELNISQQNILRLTGIIQGTEDNKTPAIPGRSFSTQKILTYTGAGEEGLRADNIIVPTQYRHLSRALKKSPKRKPEILQASLESTSSTSTSPTEAILNDARDRLRTLEEESKDIDRTMQTLVARKQIEDEQQNRDQSPPLLTRFTNCAAETDLVLPTGPIPVFEFGKTELNSSKTTMPTMPTDEEVTFTNDADDSLSLNSIKESVFKIESVLFSS